MVAHEVFQVRFLAENVSGQPEAGLHVQTPAVKVKIKPVDSSDRRIHTVKSHNREALILGPNASLEPAFSRFGQRGQVEDYAANFAQELPANVVELIVLAVESVRVDVNHLEEPIGNVRRTEHAAQMRDGVDGRHFSLLGLQH